MKTFNCSLDVSQPPRSLQRLHHLPRRRSVMIIASILFGGLILGSGAARAQGQNLPPWCGQLANGTPNGSVNVPNLMCYGPSTSTGSILNVSQAVTIATAGGLANGHNYYSDENLSPNNPNAYGFVVNGGTQTGTAQINVQGEQILDLSHTYVGVAALGPSVDIAANRKTVVNFLPTSTTNVTISIINDGFGPRVYEAGLYAQGRMSGSVTSPDYRMVEVILDGNLAIHLNSSRLMYGVYVNQDSWIHGTGNLTVDSAGRGDQSRFPTPSQWWSQALVVDTGASMDFTGKMNLTGSEGIIIGDTSTGTTIGGAMRNYVTSTGVDGAGVRMFSHVAPTNLSNLQVTTLQSGAPGLVAYSGVTNLDNVSLTTKGGRTLNQARGLTYSDSYGILVRGDAYAMEPDVTATDTQVETEGDGSHGLQMDSSGAGVSTGGGTLTFGGSVTTHGAGAHAVNLDGGTLTLNAGTYATDNASNFDPSDPSYALHLVKGDLTTNAGVTFKTLGGDTSVIDYAPANAGDVSAVFDPSTMVEADGDNSNGVKADGKDFSIGTGGTVSGLSLGNIKVAGINSAAVAARNATLTLNGGQFNATNIGTGSWGAKAEQSGAVAFTNGANTGGAGIWAANGGTLEFNDATATASGSLVRLEQGATASDVGTLDLSARGGRLNVGALVSDGTGAFNGVVQMGTNAANTLDVGGAQSAATFAGSIEGAGGLTKSGSGVQTLSGAHVFDYTGATDIASGTLKVAGGATGRDANSDLKVFNLQSNGTLDIGGNGMPFALRAVTGSGVVSLGNGLASQDLVLGDDTAGNFAFSGAIEGTGAGSVVKVGSNTVALSGARAFDYTGRTEITGGTLAMTGADINGAGRLFDIRSGGALDISAATSTPLQGYQGFQAGLLTGDGAVRLGGRDLFLNGRTGSGTETFSGAITGTGRVVMNGKGTQILSGDNAFGYNGDTVLTDGVLAIRDIPDIANFDHSFILNGGWLDLSDDTFDANDTDGNAANQWEKLNIQSGPNGGQGGIIGGNDKTTIGGNGADEDMNAQIVGGIYVVKDGSNTETLSANNSYVGNTRILDGMLKVSADGNLGDTSKEREVVLQGGGLEIAGSFDSLRQLQLRRDGSVQVDGSNTKTTWGSVVGSNYTLTKAGAGELVFGGASQLGHADVRGGSLDLGMATVGSSSDAAAAITQDTGTTVSLNHGSVSSAGDAVVVNGTSTLKLYNGTAITAGAGKALYRVTSGMGTVDTYAQRLGGRFEADGAGSGLALNLYDGSVFTGLPDLNNGATASLSTDASSTWNMTGSATLTGLTNAGSIVFGASQQSGLQIAAAGGTDYRTLLVKGDYAGDNGNMVMRTELNAGGSLANQHTDHLVITGNVIGQTILDLQTSGSGANTNVALNNKAISTEGISLVQVGGHSTVNAFKLAGGYVAASGSPFQYRLFAYGPNAWGTPNASQSLLPNGQTAMWDYRLQTSYTDASGNVHPGIEPSGNGGNPNPTHSTLIPQGTSYLTAPLALVNYGNTVMDGLNRRLGEVRSGRFEQPNDSAEMYVRTINSRNSYSSNLDFQRYGYSFNQRINAMQIGGNWLHMEDNDQDIRLGAAVTLGSTSVNPETSPVESSEASINAHSLALMGTWMSKSGLYVDGVLSGGHYDGDVKTSKLGKAGAVVANDRALSVEVGRSFKLDDGIEIEPEAQVLGQVLSFKHRTDKDGIYLRQGSLNAWTARIGARMMMPVASTQSWVPYIHLQFQHTWTNEPTVGMSSHTFDEGDPGSAVRVGLGASGQINPNWSVYGELDGQRRLGGYGFNSVSATLGLRYSF